MARIYYKWLRNLTRDLFTMKDAELGWRFKPAWVVVLCVTTSAGLWWLLVAAFFSRRF